MDKKLEVFYKTLLGEFGKWEWWEHKTRFEIILGAILTQNTNWENVKKAIKNLEDNNLLKPENLNKAKTHEIARLIKPAGYFNQKAKKIKSFMEYFEKYGDTDTMKRADKDQLRVELLDVWGIGPETADAILLYALDKPSFVVDAYTKRIFSRMGWVDKTIDYEELRDFFESRMEPDVEKFKELHALIVEHAKKYCKPKPDCAQCPIKDCAFYKKNLT